MQLIDTAMVFVEFFFAKLLFAKRRENNFHEKFFVAKVRILSLISFLRKNVKFCEKVCEIQTNIFAFFSKSSRSAQTLCTVFYDIRKT